MGHRLSGPAKLALLLLALLASFGTLWAFQRGGRDFDVFHHAWQLVIQGRGAEIYRDSPDRFLYAPGFAWLLAPLGYLPRDGALALWCFAKAATLGLLASQLAGRARDFAAVALGFLILARPLLIDFQYGQVNLLILGAVYWAVLRHLSSGGSRWVDGLAWALAGIAAVAKIFPLPILLVPFVVPAFGRKAWAGRIGATLGAALVLALPFAARGMDGGLALMDGWRVALAAKGLPLESHNQSFAAFLRHFFSDEATHVISWGRIHEKIGVLDFGPRTLAALSWAWTLSVTGVILAWLSTAWRSRSSLEWAAILVALVILPSHLVWKPYFLFGLPVAALAVMRSRGRPGMQLALAGLFALINLTTFDFIGGRASGYLEAASVMLWAYLGLLVLTARAGNSDLRA